MNSCCVLHVENDENDRFLLEYCWNGAGGRPQLRAAADGQEALEYLQGVGQYADRFTYPLPCLVLLDLKMPVMDGLEVLRWIREQGQLRELVVILLSSSGLEEDVGRAMELGANAFVTKPSTIERWRKLVESIKNFWLAFHEFPSERGCKTHAIECTCRFRNMRGLMPRG